MNVSTKTRKVVAVGVVFLGSLGIVKTMQDARYLKRDLKLFSETQMSERDLNRIKKKYKLTDDELQHIQAKSKEKTHRVENILETDANFQHKRARLEER